MEKTVENRIGIHHLFIDFKSAYDSIHREKLLCAMTEFGNTSKLITFFFKTVQILVYADDIDLMARTTLGHNEAFLKLEKSARNMGLIINQ